MSNPEPPKCEWRDCTADATHSLIILGCAGSPEANVCTPHAEIEIAEGNPFVVPLEQSS